MIVDFTVTNFRSFRDEQLLSMNVEKGRRHLSNNFSEVADGKLDLLKTAGIYGANASGKSNLLGAINALRSIVVDSGDLKEGEIISSYSPFRLNKNSEIEPITFDLEFITQAGFRYSYFVSFLSNRILEERLYLYRKRQRSLIFERGPDDTWETVRFGGNYKGGSKRIPFFPTNSYLSKAGNNAAASGMMREIYRFFRSIALLQPQHQFMVGRYYRDETRLSRFSEILSVVDTGVVRISSEEQETRSAPIFPENMPEGLKKALLEENKYKFAFWHETEEGDPVSFDEDLESDGTRRLFNILPIMVEALRRGDVLLVDEIESSFHPHWVATVVRLFNDPVVNRRNAQLIFCTHDTSLLNSSVFRRDQLWFTEKTKGVSRLYSMDEYDQREVRPNGPFRSWYSDGRFGAIPNIDYDCLVRSICGVVDMPRINKEVADAQG